MRRREFITLVAGAAAWPLAARAQQAEKIARIAVFARLAETDAEYRARYAAFQQRLRELGWGEGRIVRIDFHDTSLGVGATDVRGANVRKVLADLVARAPDVILTVGSGANLEILQEATRTIPIVFVLGTDPVGAGFVESLARPGGNTTGFISFDFGISAKWLELLKELAPRVTRVAVLREGANPTGIGMWAAMQSVAPSLGVELRPIGVRDAPEIERGIAAFAREPNSGLIVTSGSLTTLHRDLIATLAARHHLPAVYPYRYFAVAGGLMSYGPNTSERYREAAGYVDRILKGEKPGDLPVQAPTKFEMVINLKTAKAIGLDIPPTLLARADEVLE
jgi:putative tryptophan/tyrosine transport system substrate-binding protein